MKNLFLIFIAVLLADLIYPQDGVLDSTFGTAGKAASFISTNTQTKYEAVLQPDGKIILAGDCQGAENADFVIARFNSDGSYDTGFDSDGILTINIIESGLDDANAVALQPDGKIVAAGISHYVNIGQRIVAVVRVNSDGSLDDTFDGDGIVTTNIILDEFNDYDEYAQAVAIQSDGKIVVAGYKYLDFSGFSRSIFVIRYNSDGSIDSTFDSDGIVLTNISGSRDEAYAVAVQPDNKIIVTGRVQKTNYDMIVLRYNIDGSLDNAFSDDGFDETNFGSGDDAGYALAVQPDGKIIAGGIGRGTNNNFGLARYNTDGTLDTGFDGDGLVTTDFSNSNDIAYSVAIQGNGKIVASGRAGNNFALLRYNSDGSLDTDFGTSGKTTTDFSSGTDISYSTLLQPDGRIVAAGSTFNFTDGPGIALARYTGSSGPLPVELISFTSSVEGTSVILKWKTATEVNNYGFEIQKLKGSKIEGLKDSNNGWETIGFVKGSGTINSLKEYSYADTDLSNGKYFYRLKQVDNDGTFKYSEITEVLLSMPATYSLEQNYPNPFNPTTTIKYTINESVHQDESQALAGEEMVTLKVYDILGNEIAVLVNEVKTSGEYEVEFKASSLAAGVYYYNLIAGSFNVVRKMLLLK